jgi:hypothetical protein
MIANLFSVIPGPVENANPENLEIVRGAIAHLRSGPSTNPQMTMIERKTP